MMALKESHVSSTFFTLLKEGADPEIADNNGLTPLQFLQEKDPNQFYVKEAIKQIQDAIDKKHEKK